MISNADFMNLGLFALHAERVRRASEAFFEGRTKVGVVRIPAALGNRLDGVIGIKQ